MQQISQICDSDKLFLWPVNVLSVYADCLMLPVCTEAHTVPAPNTLLLENSTQFVLHNVIVCAMSHLGLLLVTQAYMHKMSYTLPMRQRVHIKMT